MVRVLTFTVAITSEAFVEYYRGPGRSVRVRTDDGRTLHFPASVLQPFVTRDGVHGHFMVQYDESNRLIDIKKL
jgi:hypothetical protein